MSFIAVLLALTIYIFYKIIFYLVLSWFSRLLIDFLIYTYFVAIFLIA